ncbi:ATP-binding protein [Limnoglobus roseus]|uniref:Mg-protoporphyrin IX chelatase n=1 Tax=Limnoglobus roseus TaxID=2598579 RepID=A0A5C1AJ85_9BACT|nr:ATP-binding protein [Limnoglobus roseus]QEL18243.1 Magnesium-chelatase 38 kDa subunit [Limnoglobus roseus]
MTYPFSAVVGQDLLKRSLLLNAVCPALGGVLIAGDRGTAKTTTARAFAALLPPIHVVRGCPFRCDPAAVWRECPHCGGREAVEVETIPAPFVELPLGATEDRVAGSLEIERSLREGRPVFQPGLLATAHRAVLYIDEVNLLADHLVDLLLDAAVSGTNTVEREAITLRHPARFILIGSMNPDEGELRPQLADRFGLRVNVTTSTDPRERAEATRRRLAYDADPVLFQGQWAREDRALTAQITVARDVFPSTLLTEGQTLQIAETCCEEHVEGLRADLALSRASRAMAAVAERTQVMADDLRAAAELVLPQRRRPKPAPPAPSPPSDWFSGPSPDHSGTTEESVTPPGPVLSLPKLFAPTEAKQDSPDRGRRNPLPDQPNGRSVRTVRHAASSSVALDATLRAAAQRGVGQVRPEDLRYKLREERQRSLVLFVVDASGSMGARRRMEAVKGVALGLLADAGRQRDEVAVIAVRGSRAECLLSPTAKVPVAEHAFARLPTGGRTPLAHGLTLAAELTAERLAAVLLVVVSDGKANVPLPGTDGDPWEQSLVACSRLTRSNLRAIVIDAESSGGGKAEELAIALGCACHPLETLSAATIRQAGAVP